MVSPPRLALLPFPRLFAKAQPTFAIALPALLCFYSVVFAAAYSRQASLRWFSVRLAVRR